MTWKPNTFYKTHGGEKAFVAGINPDPNAKYPIVGYPIVGWVGLQQAVWSADGTVYLWNSLSSYDLTTEEWKEPVVEHVELWANVYPDNPHDIAAPVVPHKNKKTADCRGSETRLACYRITYDIIDGKVTNFKAGEAE